MRRAFLALLAPTLFQACASTATSSSQSSAATTTANQVVSAAAKRRIDSTLRAYVDSGRVAGASALVWEKGREVYFGAFGMADREANRPMTRDVIAQIFSMTKPVTGVAMMQLWEQGKFKLDDPLATYLPEFANVRVYAGSDSAGTPALEALSRPITIADITRHTAGFVTNAGEKGVGPLLPHRQSGRPQQHHHAVLAEARERPPRVSTRNALVVRHLGRRAGRARRARLRSAVRALRPRAYPGSAEDARDAVPRPRGGPRPLRRDVSAQRRGGARTRARLHRQGVQHAAVGTRAWRVRLHLHARRLHALRAHAAQWRRARWRPHPATRDGAPDGDEPSARHGDATAPSSPARARSASASTSPCAIPRRSPPRR